MHPPQPGVQVENHILSPLQVRNTTFQIIDNRMIVSLKMDTTALSLSLSLLQK